MFHFDQNQLAPFSSDLKWPQKWPQKFKVNHWKLDKANKDNKILDLEQEIIQLQNRNDELLKNGDISIDFNSIGPPKSRSSIMPSTPSPRPGSSAPEYRTPGPCMNSTVDMMSDFSRSRDELRTPDISILKEDPTEKDPSDDVIDLYRQVSHNLWLIINDS